VLRTFLYLLSGGDNVVSNDVTITSPLCSDVITLGILFVVLLVKEEAQLPQRNSASAAHMEGGEGG